MKQSEPPTDNGLKIGDQVKLVSGTTLWKGEMGLQGKRGEVIECLEDGRVRKVTVRFADGRLLMGKDARLFERV